MNRFLGLLILFLSLSTIVYGDAFFIPEGGATSLTGLSDVGSATITAGNLLVADGTKFQSAAITGDCTVTSAGAVSCYTGKIVQNTSLVQQVFFTSDATGNALIIGNDAALGEDFDQVLYANPGLVLYSDTTPNVSNNQWGSLSHSKTNFVIKSGPDTGVGTAGTVIANDIIIAPQGTEAARFTGASAYTAAGTITSTRTSTLGWDVIDGTDNVACTTTCTYAAVMGWDGTTAVGPTSAFADLCLCAGPS